MKHWPTGLRAPDKVIRLRRGLRLDALASVGVIVMSGVFAVVVVNRQFGGYDLSPLIDLAWRFEQGQVPNRDFITTFPVGFLLLAKLVAAVPEFTWITFTIVNIGLVVVAQAFVLSVLSLRREQSPGLRTITGLLLSIPILYTNHLWHSTYSQVLASVHVLSVYLYLRRHHESAHFLFICGALLALIKQNIGPPLLLATLVVLAYSRRGDRAAPASWLLAGYAASLGGAAWLLGMSAQGLLYLFVGGSSRILPTSAMWREVASIDTTRVAIGVLGIMAGIAAWTFWKRRSIGSADAFGILSFGCAMLPFLTDWDAKLNNAPLVALALYLMVAGASVEPDLVADRKVTDSRLLAGAMVVMLVAAALYGGASRERMRAVGPFFEAPNATVSSRLFEDLRTGQTLAAITDELSRISAEQPSSVFFGPRIEFAYYETGVKSPLEMPLYWFPGTSFSEDKLPAIEQAFLDADFEIAAFFDFTRFPDSLLSYLELEYSRDLSFSELIVYRRTVP